MLLPETQNLDPVFSTNGDYAFAKFVALERLQAYFIDELKELDRPGSRLFQGLGWQRENERYLDFNSPDFGGIKNKNNAQQRRLV
jgi:hypothetical protein